jgi:hypothetical protein
MKREERTEIEITAVHLNVINSFFGRASKQISQGHFCRTTDDERESVMCDEESLVKQHRISFELRE